MNEDNTSIFQVGSLELFTRFSMNSEHGNSNMSSLHDITLPEPDQSSSKQWNWKYLREQFDHKNLEGLYRKYDDKLRETLIYIYVTLLIVFSTIHICLVIASTYSELIQWNSTYLTMAMYLLRISVPIIFLWQNVYSPMKHKWEWMPTVITFLTTANLVGSDIAVAIYSSFEGIRLRPAYSPLALLSVYVFLPIKNTFIAVTFGALVSIAYTTVFFAATYDEGDEIFSVTSSDIIFHTGVNLMGVYFRVMNEIVTRRSFLDRRACVESTLRLKFGKEQEERLMLSILPEHIVSKVRQDIRTLFLEIQTNASDAKKPTNSLYVEEHDNVSILYADVVNYTTISTTLPPLSMIELLNELFGRFDEASEEHDVLRIKFLGDCYYCVSGIPNANPQHAKSCVDLGFDMIHIIKDVREKRSLNIDMRIGIHSGKILSGVIGIRKWQYDIWSKDVIIANKMESTGKAGKVHITQTTLELILGSARDYIVEPNFDAQNDPFIKKNKLETYLLSKSAFYDSKSFRRASVGSNHGNKRSSSDSRRMETRFSNVSRRATFMDDNLVVYQQMLKAADAQMAKDIDDLASGQEQVKKESKLNRWTLMHKNFKEEKAYLYLADPLFKYYVLCCLIIFCVIFTINGLITNGFKGFEWYTWIILSLMTLSLIIMQPLTWFQTLWSNRYGYDRPESRILRKLYYVSENIVRSMKLRTMMYLFISIGLAVTSVVNVLGCSEVLVAGNESVLSNCVSSWHVTQCWALALLLNFLFSRVFFIFKWIVAGAMTFFYLLVVWHFKTTLFFVDTSWNVGLDPRISHSLAVLYITITLYWIDRTTEYRNKLDHLWQIQLKEEQEEAAMMLTVNNMLLENILPAHVVQVYLDVKRPLDEMYFENYDNIAVMFASLTDYKLGDNDSQCNDSMMIRVLDEVISMFDALLITQNRVHKIEKIKMAGWTYMAACGLDPNRRDSFDIELPLDENRGYNNAVVVTLVQFAASMMMQMQNYTTRTRNIYEKLNLRIGISNGEVAAGVVGSLKPLYDIWGHAVNMASRMDSTGETGKIQVTETTAQILDECGVVTRYRGETFVKGAGYVKTYFVPLNDSYELRKKSKRNSRSANISTKIEKTKFSVRKVHHHENTMAQTENQDFETYF